MKTSDELEYEQLLADDRKRQLRASRTKWQSLAFGVPVASCLLLGAEWSHMSVSMAWFSLPVVLLVSIWAGTVAEEHMPAAPK